MNKKIKVKKPKDRACKVKTGFCNSKIMRTDKQKSKVKQKWADEEQDESSQQQENNKDNFWKTCPRITVEDNGPEARGENGYVDIEAVLSNPQAFSQAGRPLYIPGTEIPIRQFNPLLHSPEYAAWIAYGKRRTGKTFVMRDYFYWKRHEFDQVYVFTETKVNGFWEQYVPRKAIYDGWDEAKAHQILETNTWAMQNPKEARQKGFTDRTAVILDDVISNKKLRSAGDDGVYAALYVQGRHTHMTVGTATQKATAIPPKVRDNIDLVFILRQESETEVDRIHKEHMSRLNKTTAREMINYYTQTFEKDTPREWRYTFVIDTDPTKSYNERFYYYIPVDHGPFRLGSKNFWEELDY